MDQWWPTLKTILRIITRALFILTLIAFVASLALWILNDLGIVVLPALEPINVTIAAILSGVGWFLSQLAEKGVDKKLAQIDLSQNATANGDHNTIVQGSNHKVAGDNAVQADRIETVFNQPTINLPQPTPSAAGEKTYLLNLQRRCLSLPLGALGGEEGTGEEATLQDVYIDLDTETLLKEEEGGGRGLLRREPEQATLFGRDKPKRLSALRAATQHKRLVILGKPGSGKSSFVRYLVAKLAYARREQTAAPDGWPPLLPLFTVLRDLAPRLVELPLAGKSAADQNKLLLAAVQAQWQADLDELKGELNIDELLQKEGLLLVFDGLDEVPRNARRRVQQAMKAISREYPRIEHILVTCRVRSYTGNAQLAGFETVTLAAFDSEKISNFIVAWYQTQVRLQRLDETTADDRTADLQRAATTDNLILLAENPMLLTTMTLIHQEKVGLPRERVKLYKLGVDVLLRRWQKRKGLEASAALETVLDDDRRLLPLMERIAYEAHQTQTEQEAADLPRGEMLTLLEQPQYLGSIELADEFLDYVDHRAGLLVGRGGDVDGGEKPAVYSFPHRTFQEYLAGCYMITGRGVTRNFQKHAQQDEYWTLAAQLGAEELLHNRQQEVAFLDLAYRLCPDSLPTTASQWRTTLWSGHMAVQAGRSAIERDAEEATADSSYLTRLLPHLATALVDSPLTLPERAEAGRLLAQLGDVRPEVVEVDAMPFGWVPRGAFEMGSGAREKGARKDEKPRHTVELAYDYWLGQYPVTNAQFRSFVADGGYASRRYWSEAEKAGVWGAGQITARFESEPRRKPYDFGMPFLQLDNHPVVGVTWYEALAFGRWLTERWQQQGMLPAGWVVGLPSEAEWEKGARGGGQIPTTPLVQQAIMGGLLPPTTPDMMPNPNGRRRYTWGVTKAADKLTPDLANYSESRIGATNAVGMFPQQGNPYGCAEMLGNVLEWTRSHWQAYGKEGYQPADGREDLTAGIEVARVWRGGSWATDESWCRCAYRFGDGPSYRYYYFGFRVVVSPSISGL